MKLLMLDVWKKQNHFFLLLTALDVRMGMYEILTYESGIYENRYMRMAKYETVRRQSMKNDAKV